MDPAILLALTAAFLWGLGDFFAKGATKISFLNYMLMSSLPVIVYSYALFEPFPFEGLPLLVITCAALGFTSFYFYDALKMDRVGIVSPLSSTYVLLVVFLAVFLAREPFSPLQILGTIIAIAGIILTLLEDIPHHKTIRRETIIQVGILFVVWGAAMFQMKYLSQIYSGEQISFSISFVFIIVSVITILWKKEKIQLSNEGGLAFLAGMGWSAGTMVYNTALKTANISLISSITSFYPIVALILGILVGKESIRTHQIIGIILTLAGIAIVYAFSLSG